MKTLALMLLPWLCAAGPTPDLRALIDSANGAPAEFAADAFIRISALDQVEKSRKIVLLQQAFERASAAQEPYKRRASITRFVGPAAFLNRVYSQDLDAMSLRLRAIEAMLPLDARRARDLFLQMPAPRLPQVACAEYLVPDVSRFYEVLGSVAASPAFTPKEIQDREPLHLLERFAGAVTSPAQIAPAAGMIAASGPAAYLNDAGFQSLVTVFAAALRNISGDDRSFTFYAASGSQIEALAEECKHHKMSTRPLLEAYRLYLVNHLSGTRCADDELAMPTGSSFGLITAQGADMKAADALTFFNQRLAAPPLNPLEEQEATPSKLEGSATGLRSCEDADCQAIAKQLHSLIFNSIGEVYQPGEKDTPEWRNHLQDFLKAMTEWKPDAPGQGRDVSAGAYFRDKCGLYNDLAAAVPTAAGRETVLRALLEFAERNAFQVTNRIQWFLPVNGLIGRAALDPVGLAAIMDLLRKSNDPVIALSANLDTLAPRSADRVLPLL